MLSRVFYCCKLSWLNSTMPDPLHIFICGPHSTGKTTLVEELKRYVCMETSSEVARKVIRRLEWNRSDFDPKENLKNFEHLNKEILRDTAKNVKILERRDTIFDRGFDAMIYLRYFCGEKIYAQSKKLPEATYILDRCQRSLVFVLYPHPTCNMSDGTRLEPDLAEQMKWVEMMVDTMIEEFHMPFIPILQLKLESRAKLVVREVAKRRPDLLTAAGKQLLSD